MAIPQGVQDACQADADESATTLYIIYCAACGWYAHSDSNDMKFGADCPVNLGAHDAYETDTKTPA